MQFHADMGVLWSLDTTACETSSLICVVMRTYLYELKLVEGSWDLTITHGQLMYLLMDGIGLSQLPLILLSPLLLPQSFRPASTKEQQPWLLRLGSMQPMMLDAKHSDGHAFLLPWKRLEIGEKGTMCFFSLGYSAGSKTRSTQVFSCQGYLWLPQHFTGEVCG